MISEFILDIIFNLVTGMLSILPDISWSIDTGAFGVAFDIIRVAGYLLPANTIAAIGALIITLTTFRIVIAIVKIIWEILPLG